MALIRALAVAALSFTLVTSARAETIVQNDSIPPSGSPAIGLPVGSRLAARLTAPIDGTIVGVQIVWGSQSGLAAPSQEAAIRISAFDANPFMPASTLATIVSPTLVDGAVNEFRFLDPATNLIPMAVPITAGTSFFVDLELAQSSQDSNNPNTPGPLMDTDGFLPARNSFNSPGMAFWADIFLGGDMAIRAIIQPVPEPSSAALLATGLLALCLMRRFKRR